MELLKLAAIMVIIIITLRFKQPLAIAMLAGIVGAILLFQINLLQAIRIMALSTISGTTISLVLAFYFITYLQRMMEKRGMLILAEESLSGLFNSRRVNAMLAPFVIGLLPSVGSVIIAAPIVDKAGGDYISKEDKTFITSYFRHISEAFLPTYASIILALKLSKVDMTAFVLSMLPVAAVMFLLGYVFYVRKIPRDTGLPPSHDKKKEAWNLVRSLWPIAITIILILAVKMQVELAVLIVIIINGFVNRFTLAQLMPMFRSAFESKLILSTFVIMMFKDILTDTGVIARLPEAFSVLPIPAVVIFALVFLLGTMIAGTQAIIALAIPLAFASIPGGGLALMVLLMSMTYIAMQISPVHVCLTVVTEQFHTTFFSLVQRTLPVMAVFLVVVSGYSYLVSILQ